MLDTARLHLILCVASCVGRGEYYQGRKDVLEDLIALDQRRTNRLTVASTRRRY